MTFTGETKYNNLRHRDFCMLHSVFMDTHWGYLNHLKNTIKVQKSTDNIFIVLFSFKVFMW